MFNVMNTEEIKLKIRVLVNEGFKENVGFRVVYFNNSAELKVLK